VVDEDLSVYFADFGVPVTFAGAPAGLLGNLDVADQEQLARDGLGPVMGTIQYIEVPTAGVALLEEEMALTVDGAGYTVLKKVRVDDGKLSHVYLEDA
jgi:hypothetical protein